MSGLDSVIGVHFNPRTSCEVRRKHTCGDNRHDRFQSTHLVWGATCLARYKQGPCYISIHAPRVRCDLISYSKIIQNVYFNPRTSCEVRLFRAMRTSILLAFQSTHLVWGATCEYDGGFYMVKYFNPRTSCEVRLSICSSWPRELIFQSTHLVWGATEVKGADKATHKVFQSTHLVWGATS